MAARRFRAYLTVSLDGYIADTEGSAQPLAPFADSDSGYKAFFDAVDTVVMGGRTLERMRPRKPWPFAGKRAIVVTSDEPQPVPKAGIEAFAGDVAELADNLAAEKGKDIWIVGGAEVVAQFLAAGRLHQLELLLVPRLLGGGTPLFPTNGPARSLRLEANHSFANGVVKLTYVPGQG